MAMRKTSSTVAAGAASVAAEARAAVTVYQAGTLATPPQVLHTEPTEHALVQEAYDALLHRLAEERRVHRRHELVEAIVEPEHVEVFDVGVGVLELVGRRVAHRADRHALPLLARAHQGREEVAIAREEHGDVEGAGHRRVVEHVDGERDVDALLLRAGERLSLVHI